MGNVFEDEVHVVMGKSEEKDGQLVDSNRYQIPPQLQVSRFKLQISKFGADPGRWMPLYLHPYIA